MVSQRDAQSAGADGSVAHRLEDHTLRPAAVPFAVENALPGPEIELARGDGDDDLVTDGERPQMCGGVVLSRAAVVAVGIGIPWGDTLLEPVEDVGPEAGLVVVDEDGRGDVHRRDEHHPLRDAGGGAAGLDVIGDVDDLLAFRGPEGSVGGMYAHGGSRRVVAV